MGRAVPDHGEVKVKLAPHPCETVSVDAEPNGARRDLSSVDGMSVAFGQIPQATPAVVPIATYVLRVSKGYCAELRDLLNPLALEQSAQFDTSLGFHLSGRGAISHAWLHERAWMVETNLR